MASHRAVKNKLRPALPSPHPNRSHPGDPPPLPEYYPAYKRDQRLHRFTYLPALPEDLRKPDAAAPCPPLQEGFELDTCE